MLANLFRTIFFAFSLFSMTALAQSPGPQVANPAECGGKTTWEILPAASTGQSWTLSSGVTVTLESTQGLNNTVRYTGNDNFSWPYQQPALRPNNGVHATYSFSTAITAKLIIFIDYGNGVPDYYYFTSNTIADSVSWTGGSQSDFTFQSTTPSGGFPNSGRASSTANSLSGQGAYKHGMYAQLTNLTKLDITMTNGGDHALFGICDVSLTADTDDDGITDVVELANGTIPTNACDPITTSYAQTNCADLEITKTGGSTQGGCSTNQFEWHLTVTNHGPADATNVTVKDATTSGTIESTSEPCTISGGTAVCNIGIIQANNSKAFTVCTAN